MVKVPIKLAKTVPKAIDRREKYIHCGAPKKVERIPTHSNWKESYVGIISQNWRFVKGGIPSHCTLL
jgi:hypothetical protein